MASLAPPSQLPHIPKDQLSAGYPHSAHSQLPPARSPHSPHPRERFASNTSSGDGHAHPGPQDYFSTEPRRERGDREPRSERERERDGPYSYYYYSSQAPPQPPSYQYRPHRHRSESYETGRSTSLTKAATPFRSAFEMSFAESQQMIANAHRTRSLSSGAQIYPYVSPSSSHPPSPSHHHHHHHYRHPSHYPSPHSHRRDHERSSQPQSPSGAPSPGMGTTSPLPYFMRAFSEDPANHGLPDDASDSFRAMMMLSDGSPGVTLEPSFSKRKYSCSHPGCNKRFTTSGHLARHNRIHTGERNFACPMAGCPSKFSRQDNMMQHYRTHISPKSRRGIPKKQDYFALGNGANISQEALMGESEQHYHVAKMSSSRHGSRQNSPPRFNPFERSNSVDYTGRNSTESHNGGGSLRHKNSGIIQTHQHHTPLPHFNVPMAHSHGLGHPSPTPSPMYNHSHMSRQQQHYYAASSYPNEPRSQGFRRSESILASPTSPLTQDVEHMEGVVSIPGGPRPHAMGHPHGPRGYQLPPLATYQGQDACGNKYPSERPGPMAPPSPQSTPHTPTKYRFDPIQDCLQQDKPSREHYTRHDPRFMHPPHHEPHHYRREEEEETSSTARSSMSTVSSMTSISSASSPQPQPPHLKQEDVDDVLKSIARELETAGINDSIHQQAPESRNQQFHLQSFLTTPERASYLFPNSKTYQSILVQERLILLSTETKDHKNVLVAGLEVLEYTLVPYPSSDSPFSQEPVPERFVYIAKVDTSGNWPIPGSELQMKNERNPVRSLVHGYLKAMRSHKISISPAPSSTEQPTLSTTCTPTTSLYIFARAQPQYLFARSTKNPGKHVLDDRGLIRWWKNMVGSAYIKEGDDNSGSERSIKASWHIPGCESERHALAITQAGSSSAAREDTIDVWTYGHPYKGVTGKSRDVIPQFPDDPKSRMIQSDSTAKGAVDASTFWEMVAISEECGAGRMTGFFRVVEEGTPMEPVTELVKKEVSEVGEVAGSTEAVIRSEVLEDGKATVAPDYTDMINILLGLDFATLDSSIESTQKWQSQVNRWMKMAKTRNSLWIQELQVNVQLPIKSTKAEVASSPAATTLATATATAPINILGAGMIKRKVASPTTSTTPATAPAVNVLGAGMIKRKVTTAPPVNILGASLIKRKPTTTPPSSFIGEAKRPRFEDTKPRVMKFDPLKGTGPPDTTDPYIIDLGPPFLGTGTPQTTAVPIPGAVPPLPTSPPLGTILPPFFSNRPPQAQPKATRTLTVIDTTTPSLASLTRREYNSGYPQLTVPTSSTSTMPMFPTSTLLKVPSTSTMPKVSSTSTLPFPPLMYMPAVGYETRVLTAINDTGGVTPGPGAQGEVTNRGQSSATSVLPQPLLFPVIPFNPVTTISGAQVAPHPPPAKDLHATPQFHRPGYMFCFPDAALPSLDEWVDYMTQHETYDPILARLRVAMDDVPAFCHTSYAPFATPEQYQQRKDHLGGHKGAAPLFVVTQVIRDSLRAKNGTHPTD
ncbi:hypothetical protein BG000_003759, partial [Podila horticola]